MGAVVAVEEATTTQLGIAIAARGVGAGGAGATAAEVPRRTTTNGLPVVAILVAVTAGMGIKEIVTGNVHL